MERQIIITIKVNEELDPEEYKEDVLEWFPERTGYDIQDIEIK